MRRLAGPAAPREWVARHTTTSEDLILRFPRRVLALGLALAVTPLSMVPGSADQVGVLVSQREALQQELAGLGGQRAAAMTSLLEAEDQLNNEKALLQHNAAVLADLDREQKNLEEKINSTEVEVATQRKLLASLTRDRYKTMASDNGVAMVFGAASFGQMINRADNANRVARRISDISRRLRAAEGDLRSASRSLSEKQHAAAVLQGTLEKENAHLLAMVAGHDAAVAALDGTQRALLGRIASVNRAITASQTAHTAPPSRGGGGGGGGFSSGSGSGGSGASCGNHFSYGYCTWYVANRRCIPWFGNADEWWANARSYGYPEGSQARPGAVVVWNAGAGYSSVGHVAYVESVQPDGFTVSEYNYTYGWNHYDTRFVSYSKPGPLLGFIYGK